MILQMAATTPLKTQDMKQVYIMPATHKKLKTLASIRGEPMNVVAEKELGRIVDARIAAALLGGANFKRQQIAKKNGKAAGK